MIVVFFDIDVIDCEVGFVVNIFWCGRAFYFRQVWVVMLLLVLDQFEMGKMQCYWCIEIVQVYLYKLNRVEVLDVIDSFIGFC